MNHLENAKFRATTGPREGFGTTPQEAVIALMQHLSGDAYFTDVQQARLQELKSCRETLQETLTVEERAELEGLIEAAFDTSIARTKARTPAHSNGVSL